MEKLRPYLIAVWEDAIAAGRDAGEFIMMADVVSSREHTPEAMELFFGIIEEVNEYCQKWIVSPLTITLGDEFQGIVKDLAGITEVLFEIEERLVKKQSTIELRYIVHYGTIETSINHQIAHAMVGPGLTFAREQLENLKKEGNRIRFYLGQDFLDQFLDNSFEVWSGFLEDWKDKEKSLEIAPAFLDFGDYLSVAKELGMNKGNAWKREKTIRFKEYKRIKEMIRQVVN